MSRRRRPIGMKTALVLAALLVLAACGTDVGPTAADPGSGRPTAVPAAPGSVTTRGVVTVLDTGSPELCLGPVAESWPPQCGGPPIEGWDWANHRGTYESHQGTRWGQFVVTGTWDGSTLTFESAVPGPAYDPMAEAPSTHPSPSVGHTRAELEEIAAEVGRDLPGAQGAFARGGHVLVDVTYDDGSLQGWVDQAYGADVVVVTPMLIDVEE